MTTTNTTAAPARRMSVNGWLAVSALGMALGLAALWGSRSAAPGAVPMLESTAMATPMVSHVGNITMMTSDTGPDEILLVLDGRNETIMVYRVENSTAVELLQRASVPQMFTDAKAKAAGK